MSAWKWGGLLQHSKPKETLMVVRNCIANEVFMSVWTRKLAKMRECVSYAMSCHRVSEHFVVPFCRVSVEVSKKPNSRLFAHKGRFVYESSMQTFYQKSLSHFNGKRSENVLFWCHFSDVSVTFEAPATNIRSHAERQHWWRIARSDRDTIMRYICAEEIGKWRLLYRKVPMLTV